MKEYFSDRVQGKNSVVYVRTTSAVKKKIKEVYPLRSYPDPYDPNVELKFRSESEYLEFCIRCLNNMPDNYWYLFKHMFNPDFKKIKKIVEG